MPHAAVPLLYSRTRCGQVAMSALVPSSGQMLLRLNCAIGLHGLYVCFGGKADIARLFGLPATVGASRPIVRV